MNFSGFFIERPIFAAVLSMVIVIVGAISFPQLPIAQYPNVVPPTIVVTASYPGANPEVIADTVATPIEQEINGVENMLYISSQATADGQLNITVTFKIGTNLDTAQVLVQNRVAIAEPRLPEEVRRIGVKVDKSSPDLLMVVHLISPDNRYDQLYISNYAYLQMREQLRRIDGVGQINVVGGREYSMRVWLDAEKLSSLDLTATDVVRALQEQNVQVAAGVIGQQPVPRGNAFQYTVTTLGRLSDPEQFQEIIVKSSGGRIVKVRDVARVELAALDYSVNSYLGGRPAVALLVQQRPGSNALDTAKAVRAKVSELSEDFPPGLEYRIIYDPTQFIQESVDAVVHTVFEAVLLVVLVIMVFLQSWRASVIPLVAIPVSLIGTFAVMAALGFSLNNLTLFGLVLAIGIVVDDAIVVVENIERHIEEGMTPKDAAFKAMAEVGGPVISVALVLSAVFIPTAFVSGITGLFYQQFALTIAVSTIISAFVSLTLSPALGAILLRSKDAKPDWFTRMWNFLFGWFFRGFNRVFDRASHGYSRTVGRVIRRGGLALVVYAALLGFTYYAFTKVPIGFIPPVDQGFSIIAIQLPDGASLERSDAVVKEVMRLAMDTPGVLNAVAFAGFSGATRANSSNAGAVFTPFKPFDERVKAGGQSGPEIMAALRKKFAAIPDAVIVVIPPPPVRGLGTGGGFKLYAQDRSGAGLPALQQTADKFAAALRETPGLTSVFSPFRVTTPQIYADIDREKAKKLGVPLEEIFATLQIYLGSEFVNELNLFGRTYRVTAQAESRYRDSPEDIANLKTRSESGAIVPLGSLVNIQEKTGPDRVVRYNLYPAADISGDTLPGFSSGQAIDAVTKVSGEVLPAGFGFEWTDIAYQQIIAGNTAVLIFPLCVLFVFLTLAAQYESWSLPLAIILIVPMCLLAGISGVWLRGLDNNILTQVGFIVLVGLACKNAILIVEFAKQIQERDGKSRFDAAVEACHLRLRPILMTSFAFVLGVLPLVLATGAGAEMRQALGTAVFAGMIGVTFFGLLLTPVFYVVIMGFVERRKARRAKA